MPSFAICTVANLCTDGEKKNSFGMAEARQTEAQLKAAGGAKAYKAKKYLYVIR
jgi:hypothetical protein